MATLSCVLTWVAVETVAKAPVGKGGDEKKGKDF